jgi:hypothetical protein
VTFALVAIAGVVTPLGLYDVLTPEGKTTPMQFRYVKDVSPMGYGTPPRSSLGFSRKCGAFLPAQCPGSDTVVINSRNGSTRIADVPFGYNTRIPQSIVDLYSSGTSENGTTVSNIFNIEWRQYYSQREDGVNNGSRYLVGSFRQMQSMVLNDALEPVEGLLVDTKDGGIGFRNHTIPVDFQHGAEWTEDILFIEPETQCVDTNLTLDFSIKDVVVLSNRSTDNTLVENLVLTDHGGFTNLIKQYPLYDRNDVQGNPDLKGRAYKAAWLNNALTMAYFNITNPNPNAFSYLNSSIGQSFPLDPLNSNYFFNALTISSDWGGYLKLYSFSNSSNYAQPPNPFRINSFNFSDIRIACGGAGGEDIANISNIGVVCGLVYGAPRRQDGSPSLTFEGGSRWTISLYSCATTVKATIKSVDLQINRKLGLQSLKVVKIQNKSYKDASTKPLWGVEDSGMVLADVQPLWGIVAPSFEGRQNLSTVRKESLYLPGDSFSVSGTQPFRTVQNLPGVEFYTRAMSLAYGISPFTFATRNGDISDYSGRSNMAIYAKWQEFSRKSDTTAKILNLIWTDLSASAVIGTRGVLGPGETGKTLESIRVPVRPIVRQIKCRYLFTIPAFIVALLWLLISCVALISWAIGRSNIAIMRRHLFQASTGRILTTLLYPEDCDLKSNAKDWAKSVGTRVIDLSGTHPVIHIIDEGQKESGQHDESRVNALESGTADGSGTASHGVEFEGASNQASQLAGQHGQSGVDAPKTGTM